MKKILSVAAAGAVLAASSMAAFAAADNAVVDAAVSGSAVENGTITVTLSVSNVSGTPGMISGAIKTSGLTLKDQKVSNKMSTVMGAPAIENNVLMLMPAGTAAKGDEVITLTYAITAKEGATASFEFAPDPSFDMSTTAGNAKWSATVTKEDATSSDTSSETSKPDTSSETSKPDTSSTTSTETSKPTDKDPDKSPATGLTLALVPVVLATGAVALVSRKKK